MTAVPMTAVAVGTTSGWFASEAGVLRLRDYYLRPTRYVYSELHLQVAAPGRRLRRLAADTTSHVSRCARYPT